MDDAHCHEFTAIQDKIQIRFSPNSFRLLASRGGRHQPASSWVTSSIESLKDFRSTQPDRESEGASAEI